MSVASFIAQCKVSETNEHTDKCQQKFPRNKPSRSCLTESSQVCLSHYGLALVLPLLRGRRCTEQCFGLGLQMEWNSAHALLLSYVKFWLQNVFWRHRLDYWDLIKAREGRGESPQVIEGRRKGKGGQVMGRVPSDGNFMLSRVFPCRCEDANLFQVPVAIDQPDHHNYHVRSAEPRTARLEKTFFE